ncbi:cell cycle checkpoint protein RAD17-like isoform X2 [Xenia sp. Carnegie-2017]|uniref:cell cycle checkpoint protein RAD17-like isoform X2 n=1 Tax=Xenia sp. Carnegie-2017 TaxID=2897299 RepID=UPI001F044B92|nr:cell cycle checkpoint protein RAD17-like isoform X2 [Xenia sp. Carnegie-2017]
MTNKNIFMSLKKKSALKFPKEFESTMQVNSACASLGKKKRSWDASMATKEAKASAKSTIHRKKKDMWMVSSFHDLNGDAFTANTNDMSTRLPRTKSKNESAGKWEKLEEQKYLDSHDLWCTKYSPSTEVNLAVHKKKVSEVRDWLRSHLSPHTKSGVLLLTGPPGCGKTATLRVLAKKMNFQIQEWISPEVQYNDNDDDDDWMSQKEMIHRQSHLRNFQEFFLRANKYPCLSLGGCKDEQHKKIVVVEEIPNVFYRRSTELHDIVRSYKESSRNPVVFIVSDCNSNDTNAYRLFPKDVIQQFGISQISFNAISVTSLNKVAKEIIATETKKNNTSFQTPSKEAIDELVSGCNGDVRALINNLQFACLKGCKMSYQKRKHLKQSKLARTQFVKSLPEESTNFRSISEKTIGEKDSSLFLFRVLGKVLYCKREESINLVESSLPGHLKNHERLPLIENPENIFDKCHMSEENLNLYLHQNFLDFFEDIDYVSKVSENFSDADHITAEWMHRSTLCSYTSTVGIRGMMFYNCHQAMKKSKNVWRPLHKPEWWHVFKQSRSNIRTATALFKGHTQNAGMIHCEHIPYLAICDVPLQSSGQIEYLQTISKFINKIYKSREKGNTLHEKEIDEEEVELSSSQPISSDHKLMLADTLTYPIEKLGANNDIEEFDSD